MGIAEKRFERYILFHLCKQNVHFFAPKRARPVAKAGYVLYTGRVDIVTGVSILEGETI